jgi:SPP1 family predicted phage head-tail adaptor
MRSGTLRYQITILSRTTTRNTLKEVIETFTTYKTVRANVIYLNGGEVVKDSQIQNTYTKQFVIRYDTGVLENMIIRYDGADYNILYIEHNRPSGITKITASKIVL